MFSNREMFDLLGYSPEEIHGHGQRGAAADTPPGRPRRDGRAPPQGRGPRGRGGARGRVPHAPRRRRVAHPARPRHRVRPRRARPGDAAHRHGAGRDRAARGRGAGAAARGAARGDGHGLSAGHRGRRRGPRGAALEPGGRGDLRLGRRRGRGAARFPSSRRIRWRRRRAAAAPRRRASSSPASTCRACARTDVRIHTSASLALMRDVGGAARERADDLRGRHRAPRQRGAPRPPDAAVPDAQRRHGGDPRGA